MKHSLELTSSQIEQLYQAIKRKLEDKVQLRAAYLAVVDVPPAPPEKLTVRAIDDHIDFIRSRSVEPEHTMLLFDMASYLAREHILSINELTGIVDRVINSSSADPGVLVIRESGGWEIEWAVDDNTTLSIPKYEWEIGEVVPEPMVEILQTAVLCLQSGSNLAALSLALVALETALWDHLSTRGINKGQEIEVFPHKVIANLEWDGAAFHLQLLDHTGTRRIPPTTGRISFEINRTSWMKGSNQRVLQVMINDAVSDWLSNPNDSTTKRRETATLNVALERARKEGLIDVWDQHLDDAFRVLRNNLMHQSTDSQSVEVDTPFGTVALGEFTENRELVLFFMRRIMEYVGDAYQDFCLANIP